MAFAQHKSLKKLGEGAGIARQRVVLHLDTQLFFGCCSHPPYSIVQMVAFILTNANSTLGKIGQRNGTVFNCGAKLCNCAKTPLSSDRKPDLKHLTRSWCQICTASHSIHLMTEASKCLEQFSAVTLMEEYRVFSFTLGFLRGFP